MEVKPTLTDWYFQDLGFIYSDNGGIGGGSIARGDGDDRMEQPRGISPPSRFSTRREHGSIGMADQILPRLKVALDKTGQEWRPLCQVGVRVCPYQFLPFPPFLLASPHIYLSDHRTLLGIGFFSLPFFPVMLPMLQFCGNLRIQTQRLLSHGPYSARDINMAKKSASRDPGYLRWAWPAVPPGLNG